MIMSILLTLKGSHDFFLPRNLYSFYLWSRYSGIVEREMTIWCLRQKCLLRSFTWKNEGNSEASVSKILTTCVRVLSAVTLAEQPPKGKNFKLVKHLYDLVTRMLSGSFSVFQFLFQKKLAISICHQYQHDQLGKKKTLFKVKLNSFGLFYILYFTFYLQTLSSWETIRKKG